MHILAEISAMMNKSFVEKTTTRSAIYRQMQIVNEMGEHGRCCIVFDIEDEKKVPVGVVSMKPFRDTPLTVENPNSLRDVIVLRSI